VVWNSAAQFGRNRIMPSFRNMSLKELQAVKDNIADVLYWHHGFSAARPDYDGNLNLSTLTDFARNLQAYIDDEEAKNG
jgi:hypothetical protein